MLSQAGHNRIARAGSSWLTRELKSECLLADVQEHRLGGVDAEKPISDSATNFGVLVLKMAPVVLFEGIKNLLDFPLVGGVQKHVGYIVPEVLATITEGGQGAIPGTAKLGLKDLTELLFIHSDHNTSFQGSVLSG